MASELTPGEEQIVKQFLEDVNLRRRQSNLGPVTWKEAVKFCMAMKFDKDRALELQRHHSEVYLKERLLNINPCSAEIRKELISGKLTILDARDENGAAIALFTARFHNPLSTSRNVTLQSLVHQLDAVIDSIQTQRNGLVFVYDMTGSKFSNFDYDLSVKILNLLKGSFPARLKKVLIVLAPLWFKAPFKILRLFVKEKLRDRVYTVSDTEILSHIPHKALPAHLGGSYTVNHVSWLRTCLKIHRLPEPAVHAFFEGVKDPDYGPPKQLLDITDASRPLPAARPVESRRTPTAHPQSTRSLSNGSAPTGPPPAPPRQDVPMERSVVIPSLPPSWADTDPFESVFSKNIEDLLSPGEQLQRASKLGKSGLVSEYMGIKMEPHRDSFYNSRLAVNAGKNRYSDVLCYDFTRVLLEPMQGAQGDYINANHVNSFNQKRGYISCQGPLPKTFADFWRMIWQEKVRTIVMTTKLVEKGKMKCGTYWPQEVNELETYGNINVMNMDRTVEESGDFQISTFCVSNKSTGETRFVKHMLFLKWPDYGIPPSSHAFLHFVKSVRETQARSVKEMPEWKGHPRGPPIVVHCSAGIGRTGTFICSDICMYILDNTGMMNIKAVVRLIRTQRAFAIQMPDQYVFCHIAILQYAQQRGCLPADIDIPELLQDDF
ncbi:tyrosine-protein phosphatase non-receptor type 9-like [Watersipora subatra]|uniref:tyrosine-protein phosphatase non-receptor type 9-like n=1 Tax=Watersipora subatra TaxID=2589382 RepID=UPI00355B4FDF